MLFAIRIVKVFKHLAEGKKEYILSKQLLRSGTGIGALIREAEQAESKPDFVHKMAIALKECNETLYWIELLHKTEYINDNEFNSINADAEELIKLLVSSIKTAKRNG